MRIPYLESYTLGVLTASVAVEGEFGASSTVRGVLDVSSTVRGVLDISSTVPGVLDVSQAVEVQGVLDCQLLMLTAEHGDGVARPRVVSVAMPALGEPQALLCTLNLTRQRVMNYTPALGQPQALLCTLNLTR